MVRSNVMSRVCAVLVACTLFLEPMAARAADPELSMTLDGWEAQSGSTVLYTPNRTMTCSYSVRGSGQVNIYVGLVLYDSIIIFLSETGGISFEMVPYSSNVTLDSTWRGETFFRSLLPESLLNVPCMWGLAVEQVYYPEEPLSFGIVSWMLVSGVTRPSHTAQLELPSGVLPLQLNLLPAGSFLMGSDSSDNDADDDEMPLHRVYIDQAFYMAAYETTQAHWTAVYYDNPSYWNGADLPVEQVTWEEASDFAEWLNTFDTARPQGYEYRLPTEAEWEYACRAGSGTRFSFGDDPTYLDDYAWYSQNAGDRTHEVALMYPNAWGLYDMHGNVLEWCFDWYDDDYYSYSGDTDPFGPQTGSQTVIRGGCYENRKSCRSASRESMGPLVRDRRVGFRVVLAPL